MECQNKCFLAHFEVVVAGFGPPEIWKCLQNGPCCNQNRVKNGSKLCFSKNDSRPFGVPKQGKSAHFELIACILAPPTAQNALKMGCFGQKKWVKDGSKRRFSKDTFGLLGVHKVVE